MPRSTGLRVIAGTAGGLHLHAPKGGRSRPTTDRVRESLFGSLDQHVGLADARVLDLYAGSGALAIEALSRGAARAVLVDKDVAAAEAMWRNLTATSLASRARVRRSRVASFLAAPPPPEAPFDLVFLDPPYGVSTAEVERVLGSLSGEGWVQQEAAVVIERPKGETAPTLPEQWGIGWERSYGDTLVIVAVPNRSI